MGYLSTPALVPLPLNTSFCSLSHPQKTSVPISLTLAGISTLSTLLPQNQRLPIFLVPSGTTTSFCLPCPGAFPSAERRLPRGPRTRRRRGTPCSALPPRLPGDSRSHRTPAVLFSLACAAALFPQCRSWRSTDLPLPPAPPSAKVTLFSSSHPSKVRSPRVLSVPGSLIRFIPVSLNAPHRARDRPCLCAFRLSPVPVQDDGPQRVVPLKGLVQDFSDVFGKIIVLIPAVPYAGSDTSLLKVVSETTTCGKRSFLSCSRYEIPSSSSGRRPASHHFRTVRAHACRALSVPPWQAAPAFAFCSAPFIAWGGNCSYPCFLLHIFAVPCFHSAAKISHASDSGPKMARSHAHRQASGFAIGVTFW